MTKRERVKYIAQELERFDSMFRDFVEFTSISLSKSTPTACITFNPDGQPMGFCFNPDYLDSINDYKLMFIVAHEILHVYLKHGIRGVKYGFGDKTNIAMDIAANHMLVDRLGFDRDLIDGWENLCWVDTVFSIPIAKNYSFEEYMQVPEKHWNENFATLDDHSQLNKQKENKDDELEHIFKKFEERELLNSASCGNNGSNQTVEVEYNKVRQRKFEDLVRRRIGQLVKKANKLEDSWSKLDRRLAFVGDDLPALRNQRDMRKPEKFVVNFYADTSGSCAGWEKRLVEFAESIPEETFDVNVYSFDTKIHPAIKNKKSYQLCGGGGTSFRIIVKHVEEQERHPDLVFVVTDGFAEEPKPKEKDKWFWFIIEGGSATVVKNAGKAYRMSQFA